MEDEVAARRRTTTHGSYPLSDSFRKPAAGSSSSPLPKGSSTDSLSDGVFASHTRCGAGCAAKEKDDDVDAF
ncbi:hypothetical protein L596_026737 [Steinernema carpocapsae]|uniref:Uncharacterized protein n=1 Tax=Steinernema carpocapsae TaxID=34508 RepID=A0A4V5ZY94_STECR|nr:hypothetical protein L596_026737 [Steinernema carpocapsae]